MFLVSLLSVQGNIFTDNSQRASSTTQLCCRPTQEDNEWEVEREDESDSTSDQNSEANCLEKWPDEYVPCAKHGSESSGEGT